MNQNPLPYPPQMRNADHLPSSPHFDDVADLVAIFLKKFDEIIDHLDGMQTKITAVQDEFTPLLAILDDDKNNNKNDDDDNDEHDNDDNNVIDNDDDEYDGDKDEYDDNGNNSQDNDDEDNEEYDDEDKYDDNDEYNDDGNASTMTTTTNTTTTTSTTTTTTNTTTTMTTMTTTTTTITMTTMPRTSTRMSWGGFLLALMPPWPKSKPWMTVLKTGWPHERKHWPTRPTIHNGPRRGRKHWLTSYVRQPRWRKHWRTRPRGVHVSAIAVPDLTPPAAQVSLLVLPHVPHKLHQQAGVQRRQRPMTAKDAHRVLDEGHDRPGQRVFILSTVMVLPLMLPAPEDCKRHDHVKQLKVVLQVLVNTWEK
jgi:hypothetical protein